MSVIAENIAVLRQRIERAAAAAGRAAGEVTFVAATKKPAFQFLSFF